MSRADLVNGIFELGGAVAVWKNALVLRRDREVRGVYWPLWIFYTAWGLWNVYFYPAVGCWFSFWAGIGVCTGNLAWTLQAARLWWAKTRGFTVKITLGLCEAVPPAESCVGRSDSEGRE